MVALAALVVASWMLVLLVGARMQNKATSNANESQQSLAQTMCAKAQLREAEV
jgi:hypothetical protein